MSQPGHAAAAHGASAVSAWVARWAPLLPVGARVLDLAAGNGRHSVYLQSRGCRVTAVDRDAAALSGFPAHEHLACDLEAGAWPLAGRRFDGIVVTNYLHRPTFAALLDCLAEEGVLIYETFAAGNAAYGKPSNPDFLLRPGELLERTAGMTVVAYEHGLLGGSRPAVVQRICARRGSQLATLPFA